MSSAGKKLIAVILWTGIGLLIGMQLASPNDAPVAGPVQKINVQTQQQPVQHKTWGRESGAEGMAGSAPSTGADSRQPFAAELTPQDILLPNGGYDKPPADVLADKTAGLLQKMSNKSMEWVVSIFGSITE